MASKKSVRKTPAKKTLKAKTTTKKKPVAKKGKAKPAANPTALKKKAKVASGKKGTGVANKPKKVVKQAAKKKVPAKASAGKTKAVTKKTVSKKTKSTPKKKVVKPVSKPKTKKPVQKKPLVQKKNIPVAKKKTKPNPTKKPIQKSASSSAPAAPRVSKTKEPVLSAHERYNIGGLFACAIERANDPDCSRLRAVLRHLDLSSQEKDNLIRLSEGLMIPKLFAESIPEQKLALVLTDLVKFARREGSYEKHWREELQQIGLWLGVLPAHFQAIEHQVKR
ncbi:MAG: hypothetical protein OEY91_11960 [Nitrospirota bacterium]|nr:hypothetical protein [Nitrospirota bacterium]